MAWLDRAFFSGKWLVVWNWLCMFLTVSVVSRLGVLLCTAVVVIAVAVQSSAHAHHTWVYCSLAQCPPGGNRREGVIPLLFHFTVFDVTAAPFHAAKDGHAVATDALQAALDKAGRARGGATVLVPPGVFLTGALFLRSHVTLRLAAGATIQAIPPPDSWVNCKKNRQGRYVDGVGCGSERFDTWKHYPRVYVPDLQWDVGGYQHAALLNGARCLKVSDSPSAYGDQCQHWEKLENVSIIGEGKTSVIDGSGALWWKCCPKMRVQVQGQFTGPCPDDCNRDTQRPKLLHMLFVDGLTLQNFTAQNSAFWTIVPQYSTHVDIRWLRIRAPPSSHNTDGVDPQSSTHVAIRDLDISTGDDCVAIYSGSNLQGRTLGFPTRNVTVERVICRQGHGMTVGSRTAAGISDVIFRNITCAGTDVCVRLKSCRGRGGVVERITYDGVTLQNVGNAISADLRYEEHPATNVSATPVIKELLIQSVFGSARSAGKIRGLPESPIDVGLVDLRIRLRKQGSLSCEDAVVSMHAASVPLSRGTGCIV